MSARNASVQNQSSGPKRITKCDSTRSRAGSRPSYRQVLLPFGPLQLPEQQSALPAQLDPRARQLPPHAGSAAQSASAQSMSVSQSLSIPSAQTSADGVQAALRNGATWG